LIYRYLKNKNGNFENIKVSKFQLYKKKKSLKIIFSGFKKV